MGKRSDFERVDSDNYPTPHKAVLPLLPFITDVTCYTEPCCGNGDLIHHLTAYGKACIWASDIRTGQQIDALTLDRKAFDYADCIITNPPWRWSVVQPMLQHFLQFKPVWFLLSADFAHNLRSAPFIDACTDIVSVGRIKWMPGTKHSGMDNAAWYRFEAGHAGGPLFHPRRTPIVIRQAMEEAA